MSQDIPRISYAMGLWVFLLGASWVLGSVSAADATCDPCKDCEACLAIDFVDKPGIIQCQQCDAGFRLEGECCVDNRFCRCPHPTSGDQVCGSDGKTYRSSCEARCAGVRPAKDGPCDEPCACVEIFQPVCGVDGVTYGNECKAGCNQQLVACEGECPCGKPPPGACTCFAGGPRVCGKDGNEYGNACLAGCEGVEVECNGDCPCGVCICPAIFAPVCGTDGKDYSNACSANCGGVQVACDGECPCSGCPPGDIVNCFANPCDVSSCPAFPTATCEADFCGGCNAIYKIDGVEVDCDGPAPVPPPPVPSPPVPSPPVPPPPVPPSSCPPGVREATCFRDPCRTPCRAFPTAVCEASLCGRCKAIYKVDGVQVDCRRLRTPIPFPPPHPAPSPIPVPPPHPAPSPIPFPTPPSCTRGRCTPTDTCCFGQCCACGIGPGVCRSRCNCPLRGK